jgi:biopolymer transport protein ExbD
VTDLGTGLRETLSLRREKTVFVRVVGNVPYARVVQAVDTVRGAGAERIGLLPGTRD